MKKRTDWKFRCMLVAGVLIFGSVGVVRRQIPEVSSGFAALIRSVLGALFLLLILLLGRRKLSFPDIRRNLPALCLAGACLGFNWIFLFEAYNYTSVAVATLCYYMGPFLVTLLSPLLFHEKITLRRMICMLLVLAGMVPVSGLLDGAGTVSAMGLFLALLAAALYAGVMIFNRYIHDVFTYDRTIAEMAVSALVVLPYVLFKERPTLVSFDGKTALILLILGIVHTGIAYALFFGSVHRLPAQTVAVVSYLDPVTAIFLSATVLGERLTLWTAAGAVLILGSTVVSELSPDSRNRT